MSAGPTKIPPVPPQQLPTPPARLPDGPIETKIEKIPAALTNARDAVQIKGEVTDVSSDGTVRIKTEQGEIQVKIPDARNLRPGQTVEIEIPPGQNPQNARITPEPPPPATIAPTPEPPRGRDTPVDVDVRPPQADQSPRPAPEPALLLRPISAEDAARYIREIQNANAATIAPTIATGLTTTSITSLGEILTPLDFNIRIEGENNLLLTRPANPGVISLPSLGLTLSEAPAPSVALLQSFQADPGGKPRAPLPVFTATAAILGTEAPQPALLPTSLGGDIAPPALALGDGAAIPPILTEPVTITIGSSTILAAPGEPAAPLSLPVTGQTAIPQPIFAGRGKEILTNALVALNGPATDIPALVIAPSVAGGPALIATMSTDNRAPSFFTALGPPAVLEQLIPGQPVLLGPQPPAIAEFPNLPGAGAATAPPLPVYFLTPEPWPLMDEIYQTLQQIAPQAAQNLGNLTPSPANPAQLGPAALFFIAVLRGGDLGEWLGRAATDALHRAGKGSLLERLAGENAALGRLATESPAQDWRALSLPLLWDNQINKIALHYKNDSGRDHGEGEGSGQVRFVFDMALDAMGKVQFDGLFRPRRLDLIVRTQESFSPAMQMEMRRIYADALGQTQITGELSFQNNPDQWVTIPPTKGMLLASSV